MYAHPNAGMRIFEAGSKIVAGIGRRIESAAGRAEHVSDESVHTVPVAVAAIFHIGQKNFRAAEWTFRFLVFLVGKTQPCTSKSCLTEIRTLEILFKY